MSLLLDTHVVIWMLTAPSRLPPRIQKLIVSDADEVLVSHASLWEIGTKYPLGRKTAPPLSASETLTAVIRSGFPLLPIELGHILAMEQLPLLHGNPTDRLLVAQALTEGLNLITHDRRLAAYSDTVILF